MAVTEFNVTSRLPFANGTLFGKVGPYEIIEGVVKFSIDPSNDRNTPINDLGLAPINAKGLVEFSSEFTILSPQNPDKGNRKILLDVLNRGRKTD